MRCPSPVELNVSPSPYRQSATRADDSSSREAPPSLEAEWVALACGALLVTMGILHHQLGVAETLGALVSAGALRAIIRARTGF